MEQPKWTCEVEDILDSLEPESWEASAQKAGSRVTPPKLENGGDQRLPLQGWLLKRKSEDSRSRLFGNFNRRFFVLDFEAQILTYSHSESSRMVSAPIAFREIVSVEHLTTGEGAPNTQPDSARSKEGTSTSGLRMPRMSSLATFGKASSQGEQHGFRIRTTEKSLEVMCSTKDDAELWLPALREAMSQGALQITPKKAGIMGFSSDEGGFISTAPGSSDSSLRPTPRDLLRVDGPAGTSTPSAQGSPRDPANKDDSKAQPGSARRGVFGLLSGRGRKPSCEAPSEQAKDAGADPEAVGAVPKAEAWNFESNPSPVEAGVDVCQRYADRGAGMSLQQRLASMDFSDDEDEDEESDVKQAPKKAAGSERGRAASGAAPSAAASRLAASVSHDETEAFQQPDSDDDD